jgi:hypothetical protein
VCAERPLTSYILHPKMPSMGCSTGLVACSCSTLKMVLEAIARQHLQSSTRPKQVSWTAYLRREDVSNDARASGHEGSNCRTDRQAEPTTVKPVQEACANLCLGVVLRLLLKLRMAPDASYKETPAVACPAPNCLPGFPALPASPPAPCRALNSTRISAVGENTQPTVAPRNATVDTMYVGSRPNLQATPETILNTWQCTKCVTRQMCLQHSRGAVVIHTTSTCGPLAASAGGTMHNL